MNERIIDKIKKLIRHERSARKCSTPEEAAAFAARVQQLCIQHKIDAENINVEDEATRGPQIGDEEYVTGHARRSWSSRVSSEDSILINCVAKAHFCCAIVNKGTNIVTLIGEEQDRAVCRAMFEYLRDQMRRGCQLARREQIKRRRTVRRFRYFYCFGFVAAVGYRYEQMREAANNTTTALVRAESLVNAHVEANYETTTRSTSLDGRKNWAAIGAGARHGREVNLATNVVHQPSVVTRQLTE